MKGQRGERWDQDPSERCARHGSAFVCSLEMPPSTAGKRDGGTTRTHSSLNRADLLSWVDMGKTGTGFPGICQIYYSTDSMPLLHPPAVLFVRVDQMNLTYLYICNVCPPDSDPTEIPQGKLTVGDSIFAAGGYICLRDRSNLALGSRRRYQRPLRRMGLGPSPPIQYERMMALGGVAENGFADTERIVLEESGRPFQPRQGAWLWSLTKSCFRETCANEIGRPLADHCLSQYSRSACSPKYPPQKLRPVSRPAGLHEAWVSLRTYRRKWKSKRDARNLIF